MSARKHKAVTLEVKMAVVKAAAKNNNKSDLAKQFNITRTSIRDILSSKEAIMQEILDGGGEKRSRLTAGKHSEMEEALMVWIKQVRSENIPVTSEIMKSKRYLSLKAMEVVRRYTEKSFTDPAILKLSDALDEALYQLRAKKQTQKRLSDYFS
uniref:HTH CENPB-type domain-containing protein n=1 Tax=Ditylenchus dipsaci TaxID=166011 RepID=A0A915EBM8_9BILA